MRAPPLWLKQRSHLLIPSHGALRFQHINLGGHEHSDRSNNAHVTEWIILRVTWDLVCNLPSLGLGLKWILIYVHFLPLSLLNLPTKKSILFSTMICHKFFLIGSELVAVVSVNDWVKITQETGTLLKGSLSARFWVGGKKHEVCPLTSRNSLSS